MMGLRARFPSALPAAAKAKSAKSAPDAKPEQSVASAPAQTMIGLQAGGQYWLVDAAGACLDEVAPLAVVPLTRSWFRGLAAVRGRLLGVVDWSAFTGGALTPVTHDSRLLHEAHEAGADCALLVGSVVGERAMSELTPVLDIPDDDCTWAGARLRDARGRVWQVINLPALMQHPDFQEICA